MTVLQYFRIMSPLCRTVSPGCPRCSSDATSPGIYLQVSFFPGIPLCVKSTSEHTCVESHLGRSRGSILKSVITQRSRRTKFSRKTPAGAHRHTDALAPRGQDCRRAPGALLPSTLTRGRASKQGQDFLVFWLAGFLGVVCFCLLHMAAFLTFKCICEPVGSAT